MISRLLLLWFSIFSLPLWAADIELSVDRRDIQMDESFRLIFTATEDVDGSPDFSVLENDFDILGTNKSNQTQIINGAINSKQQWIVTLFPKRSGTIRIPSVAFGRDASRATSLEIAKRQNSANGSKANKHDDIFVITSLSPSTAYVQQQLIYTVQLYRSVATSDGSLSEPDVRGVDAVVQKLGEDEQYRESVNGRYYEVYERNYAIFPQSSGSMTIEPMMFKARLGHGGGFLIDPFRQDSKIIVRKSDEITREIKAVPAGFRGKQWLPADDIKLKEVWSDDVQTLEAGKAITRTIIIQAEGLTASQIPEIPLVVPDSFKAYPEAPELSDSFTGKGILGTSQQNVALIPSKAGQVTLPEIRIPYWNVTTNTMAEAVLAERTVEVLPAANVQSAVPDTMTRIPAQSLLDANSGQTLMNEATPSQPQNEDSAGLWQLLAAVEGIALMLTLVLLYRNKNQKQQTEKNKAEQTPLAAKKLLRMIKLACDKNDAALCRQSLVDWAKVNYPEESVIGLGDVDRLLHSQLSAEFKDMTASQYSIEQRVWQGGLFWSQFENAIKQTQVKNADAGKALPDIFKLAA